MSCGLNCLKCNNATDCTLCASGLYLINGTCRNTCPSGYYVDNVSRRCIQCVLPCTQCSSRTNCTACQSPYLYSGNFNCISNCSIATYWNSGLGMCTNCSMQNCAFCSQTTCFSCMNRTYGVYINGQLTNCVNVCVSGFF